MERKFGRQLRSFQELFLTEAKVDKGIDLLNALKFFVILKKTVLLKVYTYTDSHTFEILHS